MKLYFNLEYQTTFGEQLALNIIGEEGETERHTMTTLDGKNWQLQLTKAAKAGTYMDYFYSLLRGNEEVRREWLTVPHRLEFAAVRGAAYRVYDHWLDIPEDLICIRRPSPSACLPASVR